MIRSFFFLVTLSGAAQAQIASPADTDVALANTIARLTNRDTEGLAFLTRSDGTQALDLQSRFQSVSIAQVKDGVLSQSCVTDSLSAYAFFGRDLRTGVPVPGLVTSSKAKADSIENIDVVAARHGMSTPEYQQILAMIAKANTGPLPASATFTIVNNDAAGEGFNDPSPRSSISGNSGTTLGAQRLNLFNRAAQIWGQFLDSTVVTQIGANFDPLTPCSSGGGVLGAAGPNSAFANFTNAPFTGTLYPVALANKLRGSDLLTGPEISATFNSSVDTGCLGAGSSFYYGFDNTTPAGTVNLLVVLLHEFGHGLGSLSFANASTGAFASGTPDIWARFMFDGTQNLTWLAMTASQRVSSAIGNNLFWDSPSMAIAAPGYLTAGLGTNNRVKLFAPNPLQNGSSVSHFDTSASPNLLMEPSINVGIPLTLDLTRQQMRDIGWYRDTNVDGTPDTIISVNPSASTLAPSSAASVSWANTGGFNQPVDIAISTDNGVTFTNLASNLSNITTTNSFAFTTPSTSTTQAILRVRETGYATPAGVSSSFTIAVLNTAPSISASSGITRQQGSSATAATLATVSDAQTSAGALTVTAPTIPAGINLTGIANSAGTVSGSLGAACSATVGNNTVVLRVSDGALTTDANVAVNVTLNSPPSLAYSSTPTVLNLGAGVALSPTTSPTDNGSVTSITVQSPGTYTGTVSVNSAGGVSLSNAQPAGNHTLVIRASDNCGAFIDVNVPITVQIPNSAPSISAGSAVNTQQGATTAVLNLATVNDAETPPGNLIVTGVTGGASSGLSVSNIVNTGGQITGRVVADCNATGGSYRLQVSDGSLQSTVDLAVSVTTNQAPVQGSYPASTVAVGGTINITPSAPPTDAGSVVALLPQSNPLQASTIGGNPTTGVVSVQNAGPAGVYTISVIARDNCSAQSLSEFQLTVSGDSIFANGFE
jgi:hypothetical protein